VMFLLKDKKTPHRGGTRRVGGPRSRGKMQAENALQERG